MSKVYSNQMPITPPDTGPGHPIDDESSHIDGPKGPFFVAERFDEFFSTCPYIELDPEKLVGRELSETSVLSQIVNNESRIRYITSVLAGLEETEPDESTDSKLLKIPDYARPDYRRKRIKKRYDFLRSPLKHKPTDFSSKFAMVDEDQAVFATLVAMKEQDHPIIPLVSSILHIVPKGLNQQDAQDLVKDLVTVLEWETMKRDFDRQIKVWKVNYDAMPGILELMKIV